MRRILSSIFTLSVLACGAPMPGGAGGGSDGGGSAGGGSSVGGGSAGGGSLTDGGGSGSDGGGSESAGGGAAGGGTSANGGGSAGGGSTGGGSAGGGAAGGGSAGGGSAGGGSAGGGSAGGGSAGGGSGQPCITRVTYGNAWLKPANHAEWFDDAPGVVTWDGSCTVDGAGNAFATLSNGWKPYFQGRNCVIALDSRGSCTPAPGACATRVSYGPSWLAGPAHPNRFDDVGGVVSWDGVCRNVAGGQSNGTLSNGWAPHFTGSNACDLSFRHTQCGGLYENPVLGVDCPDPGVLKDGDTYYMVCTSGGPGYPIRSSKDLVNWTFRGRVFTDAVKPSWATGNYWAPELAKIGNTYVVYFSATSNQGTFAIGAAKANNPLGPYVDIGQPLVTIPAPGAIDAHYFKAPDGKHYILWKVDGNAVGQPTPVRMQELSADGLSRVGPITTVLTNSLGWEGSLVEGAWMIFQAPYYYLFYSGNGYASPNYATGVARSTSPLGPFTKKGDPIVYSKPGWAGPGHGSVVKSPKGDWVYVYHSWQQGKAGQAPGRLTLVDRIEFENGWPVMYGGPSLRSQPLP